MTADEPLAPAPPPAPWLEEDAPFEADAGRDAVVAGLRGLLRVPHLLLVALHGSGVLLAAFILLDLVADFGRRPLGMAIVACAAGAAWTWLVSGWVRASLGRALRLGGVVPRDTTFPRSRYASAEAAAALAATPVLTAVLLLPIVVQVVSRMGVQLVAPLLFPLMLVGVAVTIVAGLLPPLGACALALGFELPPLAALAILARGARRGWRALLTVVVVHTLAAFVVVGVGALALAFAPHRSAWLVSLVALLGALLQGAAGALALVALAVGWARGLSAGEVGEVGEAGEAGGAARVRARPPDPPPWLLPAAATLLRVAYGAALAVWALIHAADRLGLSVGAVGVAIGAVAAPWLGGLALLRQHLVRHRRVVLDDHGLLLDAGPAWVGTRVPWAEVRGARARDDGVALVMRGGLVPSDVLVRLPSEEVDPALQWLAGRGVRRVDDE